MALELLYFAWVRERIGQASERLDKPSDVKTVGELLYWLSCRSDNHASALTDRNAIRVAVNQAYVDDSFPVAGNDEIAIFPPVTGGCR